MLDIFEVIKTKTTLVKPIGVGILIIVIGTVYLLWPGHEQSEKGIQSFSSTQTSQSIPKSESQVKSTSKQTSAVIMVDVKGAVNKPGVYQVDTSDRVQSVILKAGGQRTEADMTQVNLAQRLTDGQVLYVPIKGEQVPTNFANEAVASSQTKTTINLNTATKEELQNLEGIGEKKADQILDYRQEHGGFRSIEELKSISGIGTKRFEAIKEQLTI
ncbi:helix-hairpin-helix domain-containing protein [Leuconostoc pseudomesenteroides]|uniref:helix-hairpin-helix domain-containing protein n=1 Tax=Leuconostoc pseudomesenteroides TaxID=33968 RepID=UPI00301C6EFC